MLTYVAADNGSWGEEKGKIVKYCLYDDDVVATVRKLVDEEIYGKKVIEKG